MLKVLKQLRNKKGFSLLELVVVIAVIAILAVAIVPNFLGQTDNARINNIIADYNTVRTAAQVYYADEFGYPASAEELLDKGYIDRFPGENAFGEDMEYVTEVPGLGNAIAIKHSSMDEEVYEAIKERLDEGLIAKDGDDVYLIIAGGVTTASNGNGGNGGEGEGEGEEELNGEYIMFTGSIDTTETPNGVMLNEPVLENLANQYKYEDSYESADDLWVGYGEIHTVIDSIEFPVHFFILDEDWAPIVWFSIDESDLDEDGNFEKEIFIEQEETVNIYGNAYLDGEPLENGWLLFERPDPYHHEEINTDSEGFYSVELPTGEYHIMEEVSGEWHTLIKEITESGTIDLYFEGEEGEDPNGNGNGEDTVLIEGEVDFREGIPDGVKLNSPSIENLGNEFKHEDSYENAQDWFAVYDEFSYNIEDIELPLLFIIFDDSYNPLASFSIDEEDIDENGNFEKHIELD